MNYTQKGLIIGTFYKKYWFPSILLSLYGLFRFWEYGFSSFNVIIWFKIISYGIIYLLLNEYNKNEYTYYQNLGFSKSFLWTVTLLFDFSSFIIAIFFLNYFK
jgi:cbb3-type cytochrome oxidase subunit 3